MNNFRWHDLLQKEMSRREFLRFIGLMMIGVLGVSRILNELKINNVLKQNQSLGQSSRGYGVRAYGR